MNQVMMFYKIKSNSKSDRNRNISMPHILSPYNRILHNQKNRTFVPAKTFRPCPAPCPLTPVT